MNTRVAEQYAQIELGGELYFAVWTQRPFVTAMVRNDVGEVFGVGNACVQLPDVWDPKLGTHIAKVRAVKDYLGIQNPRIKNLVDGG